MPGGGDSQAGLIDGFAALVGSSVFVLLFFFVAFITIVIVGIEMVGKTKLSIRSCLNANTLLYFLILLLGNVVAATLFLMPYAAAVLASKHGTGYALLAAFAGVFSFEGVLSNTNITIFNKGVLTIGDWIGKARDNAVAASLSADIIAKDLLTMHKAQQLTLLPDGELNAHISHALGNGVVAQLDGEAVASASNAKFYKALKLATSRPDYVKSINTPPPPP